MTRQIFGAVLLTLVGVGCQRVLADQTGNQQGNTGGVQASSNEQQQSAGGSGQKQAESGPALPAPDGSKSAAHGDRLQSQQIQQNQTSQVNDNRQAQPANDHQRASSDTRQNGARDSRREDTRDIQTDSRDRSDVRDYGRDYGDRAEPPAPGRERSYLSRSPRELPVYFGAEFDPQTDGVALVTRVDQGSPADRAGLRPDDMVLSLNGKKVSSADDALSILSSMRAGDRLDVEYSRQARGRAVLGDSRDSAVASRSVLDRFMQNDFDDRDYDSSRRVENKARYDSSRDDSSRDRPRTERRGLGIFRRR